MYLRWRPEEQWIGRTKPISDLRNTWKTRISDPHHVWETDYLRKKCHSPSGFPSQVGKHFDSSLLLFSFKFWNFVCKIQSPKDINLTIFDYPMLIFAEGFDRSSLSQQIVLNQSAMSVVRCGLWLNLDQVLIYHGIGGARVEVNNDMLCTCLFLRFWTRWGYRLL